MVAVVARTIVVGIVFVGVAVAVVHPFAVVVDVRYPTIMPLLLLLLLLLSMVLCVVVVVVVGYDT